MRDLDALRARLGAVEAEAEGLRATLLDAQRRHIEQINRCGGQCGAAKLKRLFNGTRYLNGMNCHMGPSA